MSARPAWMPAGGGLRAEDWARRHRLLTTLLAAGVTALTGYGVISGGVAAPWLIPVLLVLRCVVGAVRLRSRRVASIFVALGYAILCGGFVAMQHGLTEAHFSFFIA